MYSLTRHQTLFLTLWSCFVLLIFFATSPQSSRASDLFSGAEYTFTPSLSAGVVVDDNIYWKGEDDVIGLLKPKVELKSESPRTKASASGEWDLYVYMENDDYNRLDHKYALDIKHYTSPRTAFGLSGDFKYDEDYQYSNRDYTEIIDEIDRIQFSLNPNVSFMLDEVNSLEINANFNRRDYLDADYTDSMTYGLSLAWLYKYSERTTFSLIPGISHTELDTPRDDGYYRVFRFLMGASYDIEKNVNLSLMVGPSYIESNFDPYDKDDETERNWGFLANAQVKWRLSEVLTFTMHYDRSVNHELDGDRYTEDTLRAGLFYRIRENFALNFSTWGSYVNIENGYYNPNDGIEDREKITYHVKPSLIYRFAEDLDARFSYQYSLVDDRTTDKTSDRNRFFLEVTYKIPMDVN